MYRLSNGQECGLGITRASRRSRDVLVFPDRTRAYSITGLFYCSLEIEMFPPLILLPGLE